MGRKKIDFDRKSFVDLVGLGCTQKEICWYFRDEKGKCANVDTLTRWCKREFGMTFQEFVKENGGVYRNITVRQNQLALSARSAAMAIFLGKNYLDQTDKTEIVDNEPLERLDLILSNLKKSAELEKKKFLELREGKATEEEENNE